MQSPRHKILFFQFLLFSSVGLGILAAVSLGFAAAVLVSTLLCGAAVLYYFRAFGRDYRPVLLALLFYALSWFFFTVKFFRGYFSIYQLPFIAAGVMALLLGFKFLVYNRSGRGRVVSAGGDFVLVEVEESLWHSLSGVQAVASRQGFRRGEEVLLEFSSSPFSTPRLSGLRRA